MFKNIFEKPFVAPALVLSVAFIVGSLIGGVFISKIRAGNDTLSSTGSAKMTVMSDTAKINASFSRTVSENALASGYTAMKNDGAKVREFFIKNGLTEEEFEILPVSLNERYDYYEGAQNQPKRYDLRQEVRIDTNDIDKAAKVANDSGSLINSGVLYQSFGVQYYYGELAQARIDLTAEAVKDAKRRAAEIAKGAGGRVGKLLSASSGVVQVLAPNSLEVSDYGSYDTSTPEKEIMVTVRATFKAK